MADDAGENETQKSEALAEDAREAAAMGEKPDLGVKRDALIEALEGSNLGSDTRAGSLRGGSVSGSDIDPDQQKIDQALAEVGRSTAAAKSPSSVEPEDVKNTGAAPGDSPDDDKGMPATG